MRCSATSQICCHLIPFTVTSKKGIWSFISRRFSCLLKLNLWLTHWTHLRQSELYLENHQVTGKFLTHHKLVLNSGSGERQRAVCGCTLDHLAIGVGPYSSWRQYEWLKCILHVLVVTKGISWGSPNSLVLSGRYGLIDYHSHSAMPWVAYNWICLVHCQS